MIATIATDLPEYISGDYIMKPRFRLTLAEYQRIPANFLADIVYQPLFRFALPIQGSASQ